MRPGSPSGLILLLLLVASPLPAHAGAVSPATSLRQIFAKVDPTVAPSGLLLDRVITRAVGGARGLRRRA